MNNLGSKLDRLILQREMNGLAGTSSTRKIYGSRTFVDNLDIVNELYGHSGCINALCWSDSGNLLASGSDDTHVNIYTRSSASSTFSFTHSVSTGHSQNIFSVKFMPHSNDRTLVCCAGDTEVRVFDVEYAATSNGSSAGCKFIPSTQHTNRLTYGETNTRVYRSHTDRVKRIVTESSPYLFLTCSEDGDVRQFDTREPSHQTSRSRYHPRYSEDTNDARKPLISYRKVPMDLNTISVSTSQPHYLALGGSHLYCFLHDRRMLRAKDNSPQCVRRFVPKKGESWSDNVPRHGHITACKISNACPNELIASWNAGGIGFFDIHQSPDAEEQMTLDEQQKSTLPEGSRRVRKDKSGSEGGKGKSRATTSSGAMEGTPSTSSERKRKRSDPRRSPSASSAEMAWREEASPRWPKISESGDEGAHVGGLSETERMAVRIASSFVAVRKGLFSLNAPRSNDPDAAENEVMNRMTLSETLERAEKCLSYMDTYISKEDANPLPEEPTPSTQNETQTPLPTLSVSLRKRRVRARKFVQAVGTLIRSLNWDHSGPPPAQKYDLFARVEPDGTEEEWGYRFLRLVIGYLNSGHSGVNEVAAACQAESTDSYLQDLLLNASRSEDTGIPDIEDTPTVFECDYNAARAFMGVLTLTSQDTVDIGRVPRRFWGWKVARGLLLRLGTGIDYGFMESAFGGLSDEDMEFEDAIESAVKEKDVPLQTLQEVLRGAAKEDEELEAAEAGEAGPSTKRSARRGNALIIDEDFNVIEDASGNGDSDTNGMDYELARTASPGAADEAMEDEDSENEDEDDDDDEDSSNDENDSNDEEDEEDEDDDDDDDDDEGDYDSEEDMLRRLTGARSMRTRSRGPSDKIHSGVPKYENTRMYRGHCNVQTVKDVNFYGLDDEYVVSGSDCGHVFIWDKKTTELVQLLNGDSSVVNVIQGHPTEPLMAVSGIDNTVKIFSPDQQLQQQAREGIGINNGRKLQSRQKMNEKDDIIGENEVGRQSGLRDAVITRTMWSQLAIRLRQRQAAGEDITLQEGCQMM